MNHDPERLAVKIGTAARMLDLSPDKIRKMCADGTLANFWAGSYSNSPVLIPMEEIQRLVGSSAVKAVNGNGSNDVAHE